MKKLICAILIVLFISTASHAVSLPWSSTFDCDEWVYPNSLSCDGWVDAQVKLTPSGSAAKITTSANNPNGGGGRGAETWDADGRNEQTNGFKLEFDAREYWLRWYTKYEPGYTWGGLLYDKLLYLNNTTNGFCRVRFWRNGQIGITGRFGNINSAMGKGWDYIMGGTTGDGEWHYYEIHVKRDTDGTDGVFEMWIENPTTGEPELVVSEYAVDWDDVDFTNFQFGANQQTPANGADAYVHWDDFAMSTTGYIGPIGGAPPVDTTPPVRTSGYPDVGLVSGTTSVNISLATDENATCRYSTSSGVAYGSMTDTFSTTGSTSHSQNVTGLSDGNSYSYYVRCQDGSSNANTDDYTISFNVSDPPPVLPPPKNLHIIVGVPN